MFSTNNVPSANPRITLYPSKTVKTAISAWAERDGGSVSSKICVLLERWLVAKEIYVIDPHESIRGKLEEIAHDRGVSVEHLIDDLLFRAANDQT
jgi:hypothetical protein